jgi:hypothetical protein
MTKAVANHLGVRPKNSPGATGQGEAQMQISLLQAQQEVAPYSQTDNRDIIERIRRWHRTHLA